MKAYIVASNTDFTMICAAASPDSAMAKAANLSMMKYGFVVDGLTAYEAAEYLDEYTEGVEIDLLF